MFNANSRNMVNLTTLSALFLVFAFGNIKSSNCSSPAEHKEAVFYLKAFGYFPNSINTKEITHKQFHHALRRLQVNTKDYLWKIIFLYLQLSIVKY